MHIIVDGQSAPHLDQASDFTSFSVKATDQSPGAVLLALAAAGRAAEEDDHVFIAVDAVRSWALEAGVEVDEWEDSYRKMLAYAEAKGWMNSDATAIKAHIEGR